MTGEKYNWEFKEIDEKMYVILYDGKYFSMSPFINPPKIIKIIYSELRLNLKLQMNILK